MQYPVSQNILSAEAILSLRDRVLGGGSPTREEALRLISLETADGARLEVLFNSAGEIARAFAPPEAALCALINAKRGACSEDCRFCAQSAHYGTGIPAQALVETEDLLERAREVERSGVRNFCLVTAGRSLDAGTFERILEHFRTLGQRTRLRLDASLGLLNQTQALRLAEAGVTTVNHNLETSERFFPEICTTHSYEDRVRTVRHVKKAGMRVCSGVLLGLGETREDRVDAAFALKELEADVIPINLLDPRPGTPLEGAPRIYPLEAVKTIAVYRFILPRAAIKLCGGREVNLGDEWQPLALRAGATGMIVGGYLTTGGNPMEKDFKMLKEAGYEVPQMIPRP